MTLRIVISSGHGEHVRGASGYLDEVDEARRVVETVADNLRSAGVEVVTYHDDVSDDQSENLNRIVDYHNSQIRDLDVSVHFNAYVQTTSPMGTEVLYVTQQDLAATISEAIANAAELTDRGAKYRDDLFFLNNTAKPAVLIETCFVDSSYDANTYDRNYNAVCMAIAQTLAGEDIEQPPIDPPEPPERPALFHAKGPCSLFGGPDDSGVDADEGLAFFQSEDDAPHLFLYRQPIGTSGLARRLDPGVHYVACRWNYDVTSKHMLADPMLKATVRANGRNGPRSFLAWPADWGPHENTGRVADLSPALFDALGLETDDEVEVIYPARMFRGNASE